MKACKYLEGVKCQKGERDDIDCLMCLHGQLVNAQQKIIDIAETMTAPVSAARWFLRVSDNLVNVNHAFETLIVRLHPDMEERREAVAASLDINPLAR